MRDGTIGTRLRTAAILCAAAVSLAAWADAGPVHGSLPGDTIFETTVCAPVADASSPTGAAAALPPEARGRLAAWRVPAASRRLGDCLLHVRVKPVKRNPSWEFDAGPLFSVRALDGAGAPLPIRPPYGGADAAPRVEVAVENTMVRHGVWTAFPVGWVDLRKVAEVEIRRRDYDCRTIAETTAVAGFLALPARLARSVEARRADLSLAHADLMHAWAARRDRLEIVSRDEETVRRRAADIAAVAADLDRLREECDRLGRRCAALCDDPFRPGGGTGRSVAAEAALRRTAARLDGLEREQRRAWRPLLASTGLRSDALLMKDRSEPRLPYVWRIGLDACAGRVARPDRRLLKPFGVEALLCEYRYVIPDAVSPREGEFDFTLFDRAIARHRSLGFRSVVNCLGGHNTIFPPKWVVEKYGKEIYESDWKGRAGVPYTLRGVNIWHPGLRAFIRDYLSALGRHLRDSPDVAYYVLAAEVSQDIVVEDETKKQRKSEPGYSAAARAAFREYLRRRYGTIAALNADWRAEYRDFAAVEPPPGINYVERPRPSALAYHFERFRTDSFAEYLKDCQDALKGGDPNHPVVAGFTYNYYDVGVINGCDTFDSWSKIGDAVCRMALGGGGHPGGLAQEFNYGYSLGRFFPDRPGWVDEFHDETPEAWGFAGRKESEDTPANAAVMEAAVRRNLWQGFVWGNRRMLVFVLGYSPSWGMGWFDYRFGGGGLLRPPAVAVPPVRAAMEKFEAVQRKTRIVQPEVGILIPKTSMLTAFPPNMQAPEAWVVKSALFDRKYSYFFIPEATVLDGREPLRPYRAVVLPYATVLPPGLTAKLLEYVRGGGFLVCSGPPGVWTPHGERDMEFLRTVFGSGASVEQDFGKARDLGLLTPDALGRVFGDEARGKPAAYFGEYWSNIETARWTWLASGFPAASVSLRLAAKTGEEFPGVVEAGYGRGRVLVTMFGVSQSQGAMDMVMSRLAALIPVRQAECDDGKTLDIVLRETPGTGVRYLFLTNIGSRETYAGTVRLGASCRGPLLDLTGDTPRPVPASVRDGVTGFALRLPPGRFAVIRCEVAPGGRDRD